MAQTGALITGIGADAQSRITEPGNKVNHQSRIVPQYRSLINQRHVDTYSKHHYHDQIVGFQNQ